MLTKTILFLGETIRIFRRSRSGRPMSGGPGGQGDNNNASNANGEEDDESHSSKHMEDLPAPDTPAAAKEAALK